MLNTLADFLDELGAPLISQRVYMGVTVQYNCDACDCDDEEPEDCECENCVTGDPLVFQETTFTFPVGTWSVGTFATEGAAQCIGNDLATVLIDLGEEMCVKSITVRCYENVAHTTWLAINVSFPGSSEADRLLSWAESSAGWFNRSTVFTEPVCLSQILIGRGASAGAGNNQGLISSVTVNYCAKL